MLILLKLQTLKKLQKLHKIEQIYKIFARIFLQVQHTLFPYSCELLWQY